MKSKNLYIALMVFTALFLFTSQSANAMSEVSAVTAEAALVADPSAVMIDTRSAEEYHGCERPWATTGGCLGFTDFGNEGIPIWTAVGSPATRFPFNIPFYISGGASGADPEDPAEVTTLIEALLASGQIDFDTPIYLICRSAWRSHYMGLWMEANTFFNAATGVTGIFSNLNDVDADGIQGNGAGGMLEWTLSGLSKYIPAPAGSMLMPPQVISSSPQDSAVSNNPNSTADFAVTVLEPTAAGAYGFAYAPITAPGVCVDITIGNGRSCSAAPTTGVVTTYIFPGLSYGSSCEESWTSSAYNGHPLLGPSYSPNAIGSGDDDRRMLTVPVPDLIVTSSTTMSVALDAGVCAGTVADWLVYGPVDYYLYPAGWTPGAGVTFTGALFDLGAFDVGGPSPFTSGDYCFDIDIIGGGYYSDCEPM